MGGASHMVLGAQYLREVIGSHVFRSPGIDPATFIHSSHQGNRYFIKKI